MIKSIVVVGGGSAGWITAGLIAARYADGGAAPISVTLVESENIGIIGVGEGTWPTMVDTLRQLGVSETEFIQQCDATFKQASRFQRWVTGDEGDVYYHPFSLPQGFDQVSLVGEWQRAHRDTPFAHAVGLQAELCNRKLAPKQVQSPEYAMVENHGYHLDAAKFTRFLTRHCVEKLGVRHVWADVTGVNSAANGDIASLSTKQGKDISGDLFIDCTGMAALLIGTHYGVPYISKKDVLFIDTALAVQVPYRNEDDEIASATISTAQEAGWIWDIGLPSRRGVGHVFSSAHISNDRAAQQLREYLRNSVDDVDVLALRELSINPGHREKFWVKNCVAIGMSSGFLEPLEASALVMIELAAKTISMHLPASREAMDVVARQYNDIFRFRWGRIIDFLKLHYVLSKRDDSEFWRENRAPDSIPDSLQELLTLWKYQPPTNNGFLSPYDLFPAASYQYILYGMGFRTRDCHLENLDSKVSLAQQHLDKVRERKAKVVPLLPGNRQLIKAICELDVDAELDLERTSSDSCVVVSPARVRRLSRLLPLFFRRSAVTNQLECVALLGLARNENLSGRSAVSVTGEAGPSDINLELLGRMDILEPVKLDITLEDNSKILIKGLQAVNQQRFGDLADSQRQELDARGLLPLLEAMIVSLQLIPDLIDKKNRGLARSKASMA